ncbi:hypothetical protein ILYODFUR_010212 [Ilyodon furcidens]|uniref:Uncharacterized protein n=1 Tax=Ilyodon furcidens TaxID=33524 RepID=A0ABV0USH1_9TELE
MPLEELQRNHTHFLSIKKLFSLFWFVISTLFSSGKLGFFPGIVNKTAPQHDAATILRLSSWHSVFRFKSFSRTLSRILPVTGPNRSVIVLFDSKFADVV